jgi:FKBP-type peptidyl-prolyl cis-trans isomerase FkpA
MFRKIIAISIIFLLAASCTKTETNPDFSAIDKKIIEDYVVAKNLTAQSTSSGLYYVITTPGTATHPTLNSTVTVNYNGYLANGTVFDHSVSGKPLTIPLSNVIEGWQEGLQLIGTGGKIKLLIPSAMGYGNVNKYNNAGQIVIPMNSVLVFDVELFSFSK